MLLEDLKEKILNKKLEETTFVMIDKERFLSSSYIKAIADLKHCRLTYIDSLSDIPKEDNFFSTSNDTIYVYKCDVLSDNISNIDNLIVVCNKVDKDLNIETINFYPIEKWQSEDYIKTRCPGLSPASIQWLNSTISDLYKLNNELNKISCFDKNMQEIVFNTYRNENRYYDITDYNMFSLTDALTTKNISSLKNIYKRIDALDINAMGVLTTLYNNFKRIINIQLDPKCTAETLGVTDKQFKALKYRINKYTPLQLYNILEFITQLDLKLKSGVLPFNVMLDYIILKILSI